jgi:hypothetical protein
MRDLRWLVVASSALFAVSLPTASAHHSPAAFDLRAELILDGTVIEFAWQNPHSLLTLETTLADGSQSLQEIEAGPGSILQPLGVHAESLRPRRRGDFVSPRDGGGATRLSPRPHAERLGL